MIDHVSILGTRVLRTEDSRFLTTGGIYTDDLRLPGACHVHFVRSAVAHARIASVDVSGALAAPGVIAAFTAADLDLEDLAPPMRGVISPQMSQPLLAREVVRYVGEPVAVVVTEGRYQGEDAADLVDVDYDPLPAVVDMTEASRPESAVLFPAVGSNVAATFGDPTALKADLFDGCEVVVSRTILNQRVAPAPMETRAAAAAWDSDGRLTAWIPNQGAQGTRAGLAGMLGIDQAAIRVITLDVGGAFGAKFGADPEHALVCWVARRLGRPARWAESRNENLIGMTHGRAQRQTVTIGGRRDGTVTAYRLEILQDAGAYPRFGAFLPALTILMAPGPYAFARAEAVAKSVVTNTTPVGAYRGAGRPEATAAVERAIDLFAAEIGRDPAEVRAVNLLPPFTDPHDDRVRARYRQRRDLRGRAGRGAGRGRIRRPAGGAGQRRAARDVTQLGIGLSCYVEITGPGAEEGGPRKTRTVEIHPGGTATISDRDVPHGQGTNGMGDAGQRRARHPRSTRSR